MDLVSTFLNNALIFILVLTILVFVHEFGHFWVARRVGVKVDVFSIGFGRELFGFNDKHGTRWKFCLIPMGGYVKMFGDKNSASQSDDELIESLSIDERKIAFPCKTLAQKSAIVAAGPIANYLLAIVIFTSFFTIYGFPNAKPIVTKVIENSPAYIADIKVGDVIVEINDQKIESFSDISNIMSLSVGEEVHVNIKRGEELISKKIDPKQYDNDDGIGNKIKSYRLGIAADQIEFKKANVFSSLKLAVVECFNLSYMSLKAMGQIITGTRSFKELGGPIKIAQHSAKSAEYGIQSLLWFIALLSVNLGFVNLLPIPVLDGGHLLIYAVEFVFGKKIASKVQNFGFQIGLILLIMMTIAVTFNDISSLNFFTHKVSK
jgi:regulator of sigma E protease